MPLPNCTDDRGSHVVLLSINLRLNALNGCLSLALHFSHNTRRHTCLLEGRTQMT